MSERLDVTKTHKLFIGGQFPRSESGRTTPVLAADGRVLAHVSRASRKDLRDAVEAARKAQEGWAGATAYLRGQVLYRIAEMMEGKRAELAEAIEATAPPGARKGGRAKGGGKAGRGGAEEVAAAVDRVVHYAGWADKYAQVLGCNNPVAGPYYNFTICEPTGVVAAVAPDERPLLALVSLVAPALCAGNAVVALAGTAAPLAAALLGEVCATSDVPPGVLNILTGDRAELLAHIASHRDIDAVHAAGLPAEEATTLRAGIAENVKRVSVRGGPGSIDWFGEEAQGPSWIEPSIEYKTVWHPASA